MPKPSTKPASDSQRASACSDTPARLPPGSAERVCVPTLKRKAPRAGCASAPTTSHSTTYVPCSRASIGRVSVSPRRWTAPVVRVRACRPCHHDPVRRPGRPAPRSGSSPQSARRSRSSCRRTMATGDELADARRQAAAGEHDERDERDRKRRAALLMQGLRQRLVRHGARSGHGRAIRITSPDATSDSRPRDDECRLVVAEPGARRAGAPRGDTPLPVDGRRRSSRR